MRGAARSSGMVFTTRRALLQVVTGWAVTMAHAEATGAPELPRKRSRIEAVAFDGFPIFDPRPIARIAEELFPDRGAELMRAWRTRQFEYTWLRTLSKQYLDFWQVTEDALGAAAVACGLALSESNRDRLMHAYLALKAWPDVAPALTTLSNAGVRLALLSNLTPKMLDAAVRSAGLEGAFEYQLSVDRVRAYKPDARAYRLGVDAFGLRREHIAFVASAAWDAAGASAFGYPALWINRTNEAPERLGAPPVASGSTLATLCDFVAASRER
jgi:2-haloacid dehalogenase